MDEKQSGLSRFDYFLVGCVVVVFVVVVLFLLYFLSIYQINFGKSERRTAIR